VDDDDNDNKINIDDLFEKKHRRDLKQVSIFNKLLNRIHKRIQLTARNKKGDQHIWFTVPEYIFGEPLYDKADCIAYLVAKLEVSKFHIQYIHPNTLFVSWSAWIPLYVRTEFKKKTGLTVDERGQIIEKNDKEEIEDTNKMLHSIPTKTQKEYTPIDKYKPTGNLIYNPEMFKGIEKRVVFDRTA